eukprot:symbB.v1.2.039836.t1/scaffold6819.1/size15287/1
MVDNGLTKRHLQSCSVRLLRLWLEHEGTPPFLTKFSIFFREWCKTWALCVANDLHHASASQEPCVWEQQAQCFPQLAHRGGGAR